MANAINDDDVTVGYIFAVNSAVIIATNTIKPPK